MGGDVKGAAPESKDNSAAAGAALAPVPDVKTITLIGDSTIDNRVWVDGLRLSWVKTRLGIKRDQPAARVQQSHRLFWRPNLSVVENLMDLLPDYTIHDATNDGFTTDDVLEGAPRDKVFGEGSFSFFPHDEFKPLEDAKSQIENSQNIILSIGGNNFREFLMEANALRNAEYLEKLTGFLKSDDDIKRDFDKKKVDEIIQFRNQYQKRFGPSGFKNRKEFIKKNYQYVLDKIRQDYIEIVKRIQRLSPHAKIIIMNQYYPSASQNNYGIYPFMREIGRLLDKGGKSHDPMSVIHEIMQDTYSKVLKELPDAKEHIVVADITSSLNPFDNDNHVSQIEPSVTGGRKIAKMLKYMMSDQARPGHAYRFYSEFFADEKEQDNHVEATALDQWVPAHPYDLRDGFTFAEEKVYRESGVDKLDFNFIPKGSDFKNDMLMVKSLLELFDEAMNRHNSKTPIREAAEVARKEIEELSKELPQDEIKKLKMSTVLAINVLNTSIGSPSYNNAVKLLKENAEHRAHGKAKGWGKVKGALLILAGVAILGLSLAGIPFTGGSSLIGCYVAGSLLTAGGATLFARNRQKSVSKALSNLAKKANPKAGG